jgi:hypothetical protein
VRAMRLKFQFQLHCLESSRSHGHPLSQAHFNSIFFYLFRFRYLCFLSKGLEEEVEVEEEPYRRVRCAVPRRVVASPSRA